MLDKEEGKNIMDRRFLGYVVFILAAMQMVLVAAAIHENIWVAFLHSFTASCLFVVSVWLFCVDAELLGGKKKLKPVYIKKT